VFGRIPAGGAETGRRKCDVVDSITGLEHYSHVRLHAKRAALDRLDDPGKAASIKLTK
jgi:hypothetical protein